MSLDPSRIRFAAMTPTRTFLRFSLVGGIGFLVDAGLLILLLETTGMGPFVARLFSYLGAATTTWALHRHHTFAEADRHDPARQWMRFVSVNAVGALINYGVYSALILSFDGFRAVPVAALAVASVLALAFNYAASRRFVFNAA